MREKERKIVNKDKDEVKDIQMKLKMKLIVIN